MEHLYNITYGVLTSLTSFLFFYLLGFVCCSEKFFVSLKFPAFPACLGASLFTLIGWYGIESHLAFYKIFTFVAILFIILILVRIRQITQWHYWKTTLAFGKISNTFFYLFSYILLYTLIYAFLPTPDSESYLPIARIDNLDVFNYINTTQHLQSYNVINIAHTSSNEPFPLYFDTPAVFYLLGWLSLFYHHNAMDACMPLLYSVAASIGLITIYYCHQFFSCSRQTSLCIAAILLCGTFYRFIIGFYFLSSLIGILIWLAFLLEILSINFSLPIKQHRFIYLFILMRVYEWLLLLIYPILFIINIFILMGVMGLMLFFTHRHFHPSVFMRKFIYFLFCLISSAGLLFLLNSEYYLAHIVTNIFEFSERLQFVWSVPLLSPLAILGLPTALTLSTLTQQLLTVSFFSLFLMTLFYCSKKIKPWTPAQYVLFILVIAALIIYWLYYAALGPTRYQPWKFASYFVLPLFGVIWAIFSNILAVLPSHRRIFIALTLFCIIGNFLFLPYSVHKLNKKYEQLYQMNSSKLVKKNDLVLKMSSHATTFLPVFFIPDKKLHFLSASYYPKEDPATIPNDIPFFLESPQGCQQHYAHKKLTHEIPQLGCLYFHYATYKNEIKK